MRPAKLTGVVLRVVDYGDSDRVVTLLTAERGKVSAFARGARASRKRFGGALEPFTLLGVEARERSGSDLLSLESVHVLRGFGAIRGDLARIACAGYAAELARELVRDAEPHPALLSLLVEYLARLEAAPARPEELRGYELAALQAVGLMPQLSECVRCGAALEGDERVPFDPAAGGLACARCSGTVTPSAPRLTRAAVAALQRLQAGGVAGAASVPLAPTVGAEVRDALSAFVEHHVGHRLASRKFLDEIGPLLAR